MKYLFIIAAIMQIIALFGRFMQTQKQKKYILNKKETCYVCHASDFDFLSERDWHWRRVKCRKCGNKWPALSI